MVVQVGRCRESFTANGALVRLLSAVDPAVGVERARRRESFAAHVAHVRLLTCRTQCPNCTRYYCGQHERKQQGQRRFPISRNRALYKRERETERERQAGDHATPWQRGRNTHVTMSTERTGARFFIEKIERPNRSTGLTGREAHQDAGRRAT